MEHNYIKNIDEIIDDKEKLKEVLIYLLAKSQKNNEKKYGNFTTQELYDLFCQEKFDDFINIVNNISTTSFNLESFDAYFCDFHKRQKIDYRKKIFFILSKNYNFKYKTINKIYFEEYLFKGDPTDVADLLQYMIEYYIENDELSILQAKIKKFESFKDDYAKDDYTVINFKELIILLEDIKKKSENHDNKELTTFTNFCKKTLKEYILKKKVDKQDIDKLCKKIKIIRINRKKSNKK